MFIRKAKYEELKAYKDADDQGLILFLPVPIGRTIYKITDYMGCTYDYNCPIRDEERKNRCEEIQCINRYKKHLIFEDVFGVEMLGLFGKTVFLTREEAEARLTEMEGAK